MYYTALIIIIIITITLLGAADNSVYLRHGSQIQFDPRGHRPGNNCCAGEAATGLLIFKYLYSRIETIASSLHFYMAQLLLFCEKNET